MPREDFKMSPVRLLEQYIFEGSPLFQSLVCLFVLTLASVAQELDDARTDFNDFLRQYLSTIIAS